ncbi:MAG: hypothetical protein R2834_21540 [Rhodothermales bacterium]
MWHQQHIAIFLAACISLAALIGCDQQSPEPMVIALNAIPDTTVFAGESVEYNLFVYFRSSTGDRVTYAVDYDHALLDGELDGTVLRLLGLAAGVTEVTVTASDSHGGRTEERVRIDIQDPCPRGAGPGERDYFPIETGAAWTYSYLYDEILFETSSLIEGTLTLAVQSAGECVRGSRSYSLLETLDGMQGGSPIHAERVLTAIVSDSVLLPEYSGNRLPRLLPRSAPDTLVVVARDGCVHCPYSGSNDLIQQMHLVAGRGLAYRKWFRSVGVQAKAREELMLLP